MRSARLALVSTLLLGCADAVPPPAAPQDPPPPPPAAPPTAAAKPPPPPAPAPPAPRAAIAPPALEEPLLPLTRRFVTVRMKGVKGRFTSISGRSARDLYLLTDEQPANHGIGPYGAIYRSDGHRVTERIVPDCAAMFFDVVASKRDVVVVAHNEWMRGVPPTFRAVLAKGKSPRCDFDFYEAGFTVSSGDRVWALSCGREGSRCALRAVNGPAATMPSSHPSFANGGEAALLPVSALQMRGPDEGWMIAADEEKQTWLLRYNGVVWTKVSMVDEGLEIGGLWADGEGHVWVLAGHATDGPSDMLYRLDGEVLRPVPVPRGFQATGIRGTGARDVWFLGGRGRSVYQWDGARLRRGEAPWEIAGGWAAPGGDLWVFGRSEEDGGPPAGTLAHTAPLAEAR